MAGQSLFCRAFSVVNNCTFLLNARILQISQNCGIKQKVVNKLKELNLPEKPKRPLTAYFRFVQDQRQALMKRHPEWKVTDISKQCASDWKMIDPSIKNQYESDYRVELEDYSKKVVEYSNKLTEKQKEALQEYNQEVKNSKSHRKYRKKAREHNKPKKPMGAFIMYVMDQAKGQDKKYPQLLSDLKGKWAEVPENEKSQYIEAAAEAKKKYDEELKAWELKMIDEGNVDLVRYSTLTQTAETKQKPKKEKKAKPELTQIEGTTPKEEKKAEPE